MPDDDPIGPTGVGGSVWLAVHSGDRHDEIVPLQWGHHRTIVENTLLFAYLLRIYKTSDSVLVFDNLWYNILSAILIGIRRVGQ